MEPVRSFRDLRVWQAAVALQHEVSRVVAAWPAEDAFLADQMRRAARSVHANVAEGNGKASRRDYLRFLAVSRGSLQELEADVASLRGATTPTSPEDVELLARSIRNVGRLLAALIRSLGR